MDLKKMHVGSCVVLSLLVFEFLWSGTLIQSFWSSLYQFPLHWNISSSSNMTAAIPKDELEAALEGASMENKTLIIAVANKAYTEEGSLLDLFLESFQVGEGTQVLRNHLLLATVDQTAFDQCNLRGLHCYKLVTDGVNFSGEKIYMSRDYLKMTWTKTLFQADVLRRGYNFIFTDMDVIWLRNPFVRLNQQGAMDLQISCDVYNGHPSDWNNSINTGFYFVASNNKTLSMFDTWYAARNESLGLHDQDALKQLIEKGAIQRLNLTVRFLSTYYFGGFCSSGRDFGKLVTIHANCCLTIRAKIMDLRVVLDRWIKFRGPSNATSTVRWPFHKACCRSWENFHPTSSQPLNSSNQSNQKNKNNSSDQTLTTSI